MDGLSNAEFFEEFYRRFKDKIRGSAELKFESKKTVYTADDSAAITIVGYGGEVILEYTPEFDEIRVGVDQNGYYDWSS